MILLKDEEVKRFGEFTEAIDFLEKQRAADVWVRTPINQMQVKPLPNNPICISLIMKDNEIQSSEEAVLSAMEDTNILLSYPEKNEMKTLPLRATALTSLKERAKLNGSALNKMPCEKRAITLNCGLEVWNELGLILIRDEKISAVHSGDESDYSILPMNELLECLKDAMDANYPGYELKSIEVGHELTVATMELPSSFLQDLNEKLKSKGRRPIGGNALLKFASSDVGTCGANLYPYIQDGSLNIRIGSTLQVKHKNRSNILDFQENVENLFSIFKESKIAKLLDVKIKHPYSCFLAVAKRCGLPKKPAHYAAEDFEAFRPVECYAYDIYMGLWQVMSYIDTENDHQRLNVEENISRAMNIDYSNYDHQFEWL